MKRVFILLMLLTSHGAFAEALCDIRLGQSVGVRVIEFYSGNVIHSKIPLREMSATNLTEEMTNLQDMGICEEKTQKKKCLLKFERRNKGNQISFYRGVDRWLSWNLKGKSSAEKVVKILHQSGFCQ